MMLRNFVTSLIPISLRAVIISDGISSGPVAFPFFIFVNAFWTSSSRIRRPLSSFDILILNSHFCYSFIHFPIAQTLMQPFPAISFPFTQWVTEDYSRVKFRFRLSNSVIFNIIVVMLYIIVP